MASCFSRAARFLKLSKSAVVRSKRSQFSSALPARSLSSANCTGLRVAASTGTSGSGAAGGSGVARSSSIFTLVRFIRHYFLDHNFNTVRIDESWPPGNILNRFPDPTTREARGLGLSPTLPRRGQLLELGHLVEGGEAGVLQRFDAQVARFGILFEPLGAQQIGVPQGRHGLLRDRKSTRLNSSHLGISYA